MTDFWNQFDEDIPDVGDFWNQFSEDESSPMELSKEVKDQVVANNEAYKTKYKDASKLAMGLKAMNADDWSNVAGEALTGAERVIDGASLGAYDLANRKLGGNYQERKARLQESVDTADIGGINKAVGFGLEMGGNVTGAGGALAKGLSKVGLKGVRSAMISGGLEGGAYGATGSDTINDAFVNSALGAGLGLVTAGGLYELGKPVIRSIEKGANKFNRWHGKRKLAKQLKQGEHFSDIDFGKIDKNKLDEINNLRRLENVEAINDRLVTIPADRVEHLYEQRVIDNNYQPEEVGKVLDAALFGKNNKTVAGKYPTLQTFVDDSTDPMNVAIVGKHRNKGSVFVKTGYKKDAGSNLEGRRFPSSDPNLENSSGSLLSARQTTAQKTPYDNNISLKGDDVNYNQNLQTFAEAVTDIDKRKTIKNAVLSGADDLSEQARYLSDQLAKRKEGMFDPDFEKMIKTSELAGAEKAYSDFFAKNGNKILAAEKIKSFYDKHPIARNILKEIKTVDPRAFDGIKDGSLAELDMLKRILREDAGNRNIVNASKAGALKRAETSLKALMEKEFNGFQEINRRFAKAKAVQGLFESKLKSGLTSVGNATASPFWSGVSSPLASAGALGGFVNPAAWGLTAAALSGKALMRSMRRKSGRSLSKGIVDEGLDPEVIKYLVGPGVIAEKTDRSGELKK